MRKRVFEVIEISHDNSYDKEEQTMVEEKIISEQDLEKVSGGSSGYDSNAFFEMWEGYTSTHCANCAQHKYTFTDGESRCDSERQKAAAAFAAGQPVKCDGYIPAC